MTDPGTAIVGKVGIEVFKAVTPHAWAWVKTQAIGKTVLFLGPSRAGKTSYIKYLRSAHYTDPDDYAERTLQSRNAGSLQLKSPNGNIQIDLKKMMDSKGQDFPQDHADLIVKHKPHAICILLDASAEWSMNENKDPNRSNRAWLEHFLIRVCEQRDVHPRCLSRLKSFSIFFNKMDLADGRVVQGHMKQAKLVVSSHFKGKLGRVADMLNVKPLSMVESHDGGKLPAKASLTLFDPFVRD